jgi:hypothetical protein
MSSIYSYNLLTPAASGADTSLSNSCIKITNAPTVNIKEATLSQFVDPLTELREVVTLTPTAASAVGQAYTIRVQQFNNSLKRTVSKVFSYTSITASDSRLVISTAMAAILNLDSELAITAAVGGSGGSETITITADSGSPELTVTIVSVGAGLTQASTVINSAGTAVTIANGTAVTQAGTTVNGVVTVTAVSSNLAAGMLVNYTLSGTDSITLADGTVLSSGSTLAVRVANTSASAFDFGPSTDSNIESVTIGATGARTLTLSPVFARGTATDLASRGVVGAASNVVYGEVKLNWLETPVNGGPAINKSHSVYVDSTTSGANYTAFRYKVMNAMRGLTSSTSAYGTTATAEASSIN